jgi:L-ribulokinase
LGAAIFGAVAGGAYRRIESAQRKMVHAPGKVYRPRKAAAAVCAELYELYKQLHDSFGTAEHAQALGHVMKSLIAIRDRTRKG